MGEKLLVEETTENSIPIMIRADDGDCAIVDAPGSTYEYRDITFGITEPIADPENPSDRYDYYDVYCLYNGVTNCYQNIRQN